MKRRVPTTRATTYELSHKYSAADRRNDAFRRVLFHRDTKSARDYEHSHLAVKSGKKPQIHRTNVFFLFRDSTGELDGKQFPIGRGDVVVVVPGTNTIFGNTGTIPLKI